MTNHDVAIEYSNCVLKKFSWLIPILYGSTVFGVNGHDLDMCFVSDRDMLDEELNELINITIFYHQIYHLLIDEEVPYSNKLIYTKGFINNTFINGPFPLINNRYIIPQIVKTKDYLSSIEMKKRLLLNILTTKHEVFGDLECKKIIENYSKQSFYYMINILLSYAQLTQFTIDDLMQVFLKDPFFKLEGELYLGYKTNFPERIEFLRCRLNEMLMNMVNDGILNIDKSVHYVKRK